jgi:hypothetical protein
VVSQVERVARKNANDPSSTEAPRRTDCTPGQASFACGPCACISGGCWSLGCRFGQSPPVVSPKVSHASFDSASGSNGPSSLSARRKSSASAVPRESDSTNSPVKGSFGGGSWPSWPASRTSAVGLPSENQRSVWMLYGSRYQPSACMSSSVTPAHRPPTASADRLDSWASRLRRVNVGEAQLILG